MTNQVRIIEVAEDELTDSHASDYSERKQCTPGVCMEKANYPGDPGGYHKKHIGVGSRNKCRQICDRDPHCCHWVHYGRHRGHITQFRFYFYFFNQFKQRGKNGAPSLVSWRRRSLALFRETQTGQEWTYLCWIYQLLGVCIRSRPIVCPYVGDLIYLALKSISWLTIFFWYIIFYIIYFYALCN